MSAESVLLLQCRGSSRIKSGRCLGRSEYVVAAQGCIIDIGRCRHIGGCEDEVGMDLSRPSDRSRLSRWLASVFCVEACGHSSLLSPKPHIHNLLTSLTYPTMLCRPSSRAASVIITPPCCPDLAVALLTPPRAGPSALLRCKPFDRRAEYALPIPSACTRELSN